MAAFLLTFAIDQIIKNVTSIAMQQIAGAWGLKKDLQNLIELTRSIDGKVKEARNYEAASGHAAKALLVKLQDVLYDADDVLEDFSYEILRREIETQPRPTLKIRGFASRNNPVLFRLKMAHKVKKINQSLAEIERQALRDFALTGKAVTDPVVVSNDQPDRVTVSYFDKSESPAIGRASEVETIINLLQLSSSTQSLLTFVSIIGFGGLGKTTLAKMVLHQVKETTKLFDVTIWVCVSEPFDVKTILKGMLETLNVNAGGLESVEAILQHLESKLKDKRFFLVLDDVWEDSSIKCNILKTHLLTICSRPGNFVIVTTRKLDVAKAMDTQDEHVVQLKGLKDTECWDIIRNKCVIQWGGLMPKELEEIGVEIARKCRGAPLAAKVVGGTLCKKKNKEEWLSIQNSDAWDQIDEDKQILPVLKLSFHQLHPSLKQCFVYCSLFPKDFQYEKQKLIELWMAEGFLTESSEKSMEDVGEECFNGLIVHSFFQDVKMDEWGNISDCKMHDLLHDLASSVSNYKMLKWTDESTFFVRTSNHQHHLNAEELERGGGRNVRCVISKVVGEVPHMFSTFKSLRSLDISATGLKELPSIVGKLKHLRYLDISDNQVIEELPGCITKLYNLQTLRLINCPCIGKLPTNMVNLLRLRNIYFDNPDLKIYNVGRLHELRTLPMFKVGEEEGFRIRELNKLKELRGKLSITSLQFVRDKEEAEGGNLKEKNKLTELNLEWDFDSKGNDENVLQGLVPPPTIKRLRIEYYKGEKFSNWMLMGINDYLSQLEELSLLNCNKCELMPSLGHLPRLKFLKVWGLKNITTLGSEFYGEYEGDVILFPQLKQFSLLNMYNLEEWGKTDVEAFPLLEELWIKDCPRLRSIPLRHLSSLTSLAIEGCQDMEYLSNDNQILPCLVDLSIKGCRNLVSLSNLKQLKSLNKLEIQGCVGLSSIPKGLVSLRTLQIMSMSCDFSVDAFCGISSLKRLSFYSGFMKSIPDVEHPSSLEELTIHSCLELTSVPSWLKFCSSLRKLYITWCGSLISIDDDIISSLTQLKVLDLGPFSKELENFPGLNSIYLLSSSLKILNIHGWPKLESLPQHLQHLTSLERLTIDDFKGLETLPDWLGNLSSLQDLSLSFCENLKNLPTTIKSLSNLTYLWCWSCPLLKQRYNQDTGPDRHHISHIAHISIY